MVPNLRSSFHRFRTSAQPEWALLGLVLLYAATLRTGWVTLPAWLCLVTAILLAKDRRIATWRALAVVLVVDTVLNYFSVANHQFVALYACVAGAAGPRTLAAAASPLIASILALAALQKALSPEFVSGAYLDYMAATGRLGKGFVWLMPELDHAIQLNRESLRAFSAAPPQSAAVVTLQPPIPLLQRPFWQAISLIGIAWEFVAAVWLALRPQSNLPHALTLLLLLSILTLREETGFLALLCGLAMCSPHAGPAPKAGYLLLFVLCVALVLCGEGFS